MCCWNAAIANQYRLRRDVLCTCLQGTLEVNYTQLTVTGEIDADNHKFLLHSGQDLILEFRGIAYELNQLHFHIACEHKIDGAAPSQHELHLLHTLPVSNDKLVLALFFNLSETAKGRDTFQKWNEAIRNTAKNVQRQADRSISLPLAGLFCSPLNRWFYYHGSLTSYPFSEDVKWIIDYAVESINPADISELAEAEQEQRPEMLLNRRFVLRNFE